MFTPKKHLFEMECLSHVTAGACKAGVVDVKYKDGSLDKSMNRAKTNKAITWKKKPQKGAIALIQTQMNYKIANVLLLAPAKTSLAYILNYFKILLMNKD